MRGIELDEAALDGFCHPQDEPIASLLHLDGTTELAAIQHLPLRVSVTGVKREDSHPKGPFAA